LYEQKEHNARQIMTEFVNKRWMKSSIKRLLLKLRKHGTVDGCPCSSRQCIVCTMKTLTLLNCCMVQSQKDKQVNMNWHMKLNMKTIFRSMLMLCSKTEQILFMPFKDTDLSRFFRDTVYPNSHIIIFLLFYRKCENDWSSITWRTEMHLCNW